MKIYKPTYTDKKTEEKKECRKWYLTFIDNRQIRRRLPVSVYKKEADKLATRVDEILGNGGILTPDLQKWFENQPKKLQDKLIEFDIIDSRRILNNAGKTLAEHLEDFYQSLIAKGNGQRYAEQIKTAIEIIFTACEFRLFSDIDANRIYTFLADLRSENGIGQRTFNHNLKAVKQFCRWMVKEQRATSSPVEHLSCVTQTEKRVKRRALSLDEQRKLIGTTEVGETHHNLTGYERKLVYCLALQTGLRANEIRSLPVGAFNFNDNIVTLQGAYAKNKKTSIIDLTDEMAAELKQYFSGKIPHIKAFAMPNQPSKMIKKDLEAAGIAYKTEQGTADFHSLRHSFITNLARSGVHPKDAQEAARHSTITLTMNCYTHTARESQQKIFREQPNLLQTKTKNLSCA